MKRIAFGLWGALLGAAAGWILVTGCESTSSVDDIITVSPSSPQLSATNATVTFTATGGTNGTLVLPLQWSVDNLTLGRILANGGVTAVYQSTGMTGNNIIRVRDQAEAAGYAVVNQTEAAATNATSVTP